LDHLRGPVHVEEYLREREVLKTGHLEVGGGTFDHHHGPSYHLYQCSIIGDLASIPSGIGTSEQLGRKGLRRLRVPEPAPVRGRQDVTILVNLLECVAGWPTCNGTGPLTDRTDTAVDDRVRHQWTSGIVHEHHIYIRQGFQRSADRGGAAGTPGNER
jgi:hypothetical protein